MPKTPNRYTIPGSERAPFAGARATGAVLPDERIEVSVRVRPKPGQRGLGDGGALDDRPPAQREYLKVRRRLRSVVETEDAFDHSRQIVRNAE